MPSHLLDGALSKAPQRIVLCNRDLGRTMFLEDRNVHFICNSDNLDYIGPYTRKRRPHTSEDAVQIAKIVDWTRHIDAVQTGGVASVMDMATTRFCYGAPELHLWCSALADIAHYFRLPFWGTSGCVENQTVDEQAAVELAVSILMAGLSGSNLVHDKGLMDQASLVCPEILLLADEIMDIVKTILKGVHVGEETLALDVIHAVGPGGNFLAEDHTLKHFRNFWRPKLFNRKNPQPGESVMPFSERLNQKARKHYKKQLIKLDESRN